MEKNVYIMLNDLNANKQKEILDLLGIENASDGNYDIVPLCVIEPDTLKGRE